MNSSFFSSVGFSLRGLGRLGQKIRRLKPNEILTGAPSGHHDRNAEFAGGHLSLAECGGERVSVLTAGFNNLSGKTLSDFDGLGEAAALGYQSRNVWARAQVAPPF